MKKFLLPTKKYTFRNKKKSYNLSSESDNITKPTLIECFECNSLWTPCNNPIELNSLKQNRVKCSGSCYLYMNFNGGIQFHSFCNFILK